MPVPRIIRRVVLTGFMGAGKSTIGPMLAQRLQWEFADSDVAIEERTGKSVAEIFAQQGEAAFRILEAEVIRDCAVRDRLVLSLGGGAIEREPTRELLSKLDRTCVLFLDAPLEILVERCVAQPNAAERPVLADLEGLRRRFDARLPYYRTAHLTVATAGLDPRTIVAGILESLAPFCVPEATEGVPTR